MKGIIVIGHGSRSQEAYHQFMNIVDKVRVQTGKLVEGAFMELSKPGFFEVVEKLAAEGVTELTVYPLFLFSGIHIKEDIPEMIKKAKEAHENIVFKMAQPLATREELAQLVINSVEEL